jgi:hypothetical protein
MLAMPYLLLGTVGFLIYRGLRRKAQLEAGSAEPGPPSHGEGPCTSPAETSSEDP